MTGGLRSQAVAQVGVGCYAAIAREIAWRIHHVAKVENL
jgi:hypothetical protein